MSSSTDTDQTRISTGGVRALTLKLAQVEVELADVSLGTSHPKYISRQDDILREQRGALDEAKQYLESNPDDDSHMQMVARTKYENLEKIYESKRGELDTVEAEWKEFDHDVGQLVGKLKAFGQASYSAQELDEAKSQLDDFKSKVKMVRLFCE